MKPVALSASEEASLTALVQRFTKAQAAARAASAMFPDDTRALFGAGVAFRLTLDYAAARKAFARAAELEPNNPHFLFELGMVSEYLGDFAAAERAYARALATSPDYFKAHLALVTLTKQTQANNHIADLERRFAGADEDGWRTLHLGHALAKTYEDLGDVAQSMHWLARAKARRGALRPYQDAIEAASTEAAMKAVGAAEQAGHESDEPIFIVGLPRSGTTLVERILSSHPQVTPGGELPTFVQLMRLMSGSDAGALDPATLARAPDIDLARLGKLYIDSTRPLTGATPHFTDKAPSNYLLAGIIHRALPNARIVCMRRHPLDSCLGNYKQIFPLDDRYFDYVYSLEGTARKYLHFDRAAKHWAATLPADRFMELSYESLVANQDAETRRLVAFCGLPWDDACLSFHENKAAVATPSAVQVRAPMNAGAVGRWAKYGALLDPARRVLEQAGLDLG